MGARPSVADRLADSLRTSIVRGRMQPGDALPSERDLAERYAVGRSSVREALKRLETWGLVQVRHGGATRVRDFLLSAGIDLLPHLVEASGTPDPDILDDLHEVRAMILGYCAEQAAERADPASVARLDHLVRRMAEAPPAVQQELDYDFFQELVAITGNRVLALFANVVRDVYLAGRERFLAMYAPGTFSLEHHRAAVAAIRGRDPVAAGRAMRRFARSARRRP
jgi:DNA-binding FadR family transcriptional regulator